MHHAPSTIPEVGAGVGQEVSAVRSDPYPAPDVRRVGLIVDVGSSWTKLALVVAGRLVRLGPVPSREEAADAHGRTEDDRATRWQGLIDASLARQGITFDDIDDISVASVVARLSDQLRNRAAQRRRPPSLRFVDPRTAPLRIDHRPPTDLGPDRIADAAGARHRWGAPVVVADVGTALTCDLVSGDGHFVGGAIAPGPWVGYQGLVARAPHLVPARTVAGMGGDVTLAGTTTAEAIRVGVLRGSAALLDGLARGFHRLAGTCPVVLTGGLAPAIAPFSETVTAVDPDLTLWGVHLACGGSTAGRQPRSVESATSGRAPMWLMTSAAAIDPSSPHSGSGRPVV